MANADTTVAKGILSRHRHRTAPRSVRTSAAPGDQHIAPGEGTSAPRQDSATSWSAGVRPQRELTGLGPQQTALSSCASISVRAPNGKTCNWSPPSVYMMCDTETCAYASTPVHACTYEYSHLQTHIHPFPGVTLQSSAQQFGPHECGPENWTWVDVRIWETSGCRLEWLATCCQQDTDTLHQCCGCCRHMCRHVPYTS